MPADISIEFTDEQRIQFMYGPVGTYEPSVVTAAAVACSPIPVAELLEVVGGWIHDFPSIAATCLFVSIRGTRLCPSAVNETFRELVGGRTRRPRPTRLGQLFAVPAAIAANRAMIDQAGGIR